MKFASLVVAALGGLLLAAGCSSKNNNNAEGDGGVGSGVDSNMPCDQARCLPGNRCMADGAGVTACRLPCQAHADCPTNYGCTPGPNAADKASYFCAPIKAKIEPKETGQWGYHCAAQKGWESEDCDLDQEFRCYGESPADATSYCTRFDCQSDDDCAAGFWCATVNAAPNVQVPPTKRTWGTTSKVCLRRTYCSPCNSDIDCESVGGRPQYCVDDKAGGKFCATSCQRPENCEKLKNCNNGCNKDAECVDHEASGGQVCKPRAGVCKGDGKLCSPCRSDADCVNGYCIVGSEYSKEKFCIEKSSTPCTDQGNGCTKPSMAEVGCFRSDSADSRKDYCVGLVSWRMSRNEDPISIPGCWSVFPQ